MKRYRALILIVILIAGLGIYKFKYLNESTVQKQGIKPGTGKIPVNGFLAKAGKSENKLLTSGTALAYEEVNLMPEVAGKITMLNIPEGTAVSKGDLLVKINDLDLQAQLKKLKMQAVLLKDKESRNKKLLEINSISKEEYEASLNDVQLNEAETELIHAQILKTEIRAPFAGLLGFKNIGPGSFISPAQVVATIQQIDPIKIEFSIPERYISLVKRGNTINFTTDASDEKFEAKISLIEPKIDLSTRTIKARALYANKNRKILPGAFVRIELVIKETINSIMIPSEALIPILKGYKVFISNNGIAKEAEVLTGLRTETEVQILQGINPGDTVLTTGIMQLKAGSPLDIITVK